MRDLELWDVDGDGKQEVFATSERVELIDAKGNTMWQTKPGFTRSRGYAMPEAAPVDVNGDGKQEMAVLYGPQLSVFDAGGKRVYQRACDFYYFTTLAGHSPATNEVVVGSVVGADQELGGTHAARSGASARIAAPLCAGNCTAKQAAGVPWAARRNRPPIARAQRSALISRKAVGAGRSRSASPSGSRESNRRKVASAMPSGWPHARRTSHGDVPSARDSAEARRWISPSRAW